MKKISFQKIMTGALTLLVSASMSAAQEDDEGTADIGIKIGEQAPDFTLNDAAGKPQTLESFTKKGWVALVFYRSGDW